MVSLHKGKTHGGNGSLLQMMIPTNPEDIEILLQMWMKYMVKSTDYNKYYTFCCVQSFFTGNGAPTQPLIVNMHCAMPTFATLESPSTLKRMCHTLIQLNEK